MSRRAPDLEVIDGGQAPSAGGPFTAADYVQLAALSGRSVVVRVGGEHPGEIVLRGGMPWWAGDDRGEGAAAFQRLLLAGGMERDQPVVCRQLRSEVRSRNVAGTAEALLLDAAKDLDDRRRGAGSVEFASAPVIGELEALDAAEARFVDLVEAGVDALLRKDYAKARASFAAASGIYPDDPTVTANLQRLQALGFGPEGES